MNLVGKGMKEPTHFGIEEPEGTSPWWLEPMLIALYSLMVVALVAGVAFR
jgi:hypothetical protein